MLNVCQWFSARATTTQSTSMPGTLTWRGLQRAAFGDALDLRDDDAAAVARRGGDRQRLERQRLALHREVAVGIGRRRADDRDIDRERLVEQALLTAEVAQLDQLLGGALVHPSAAEARVDEGAQADPAEVTRPAAGDVAEQARDHALREVVGLDRGSRPRAGRSFGTSPQWPPMTRLSRPSCARWFSPALLAVALAGGVDQRQVARRFRVGEEALFERDRDLLGEADADEAARWRPCRRRGSGEPRRRR